MPHGESLGSGPVSSVGWNVPQPEAWAQSTWTFPGGSKSKSVLDQPEAGQVHLWWKELGPFHETGRSKGRFPGDVGPLSVEEIARVRCFRKEEDALGWAEGRAWIRRVLGGYLDCDPAQVDFAFGPEGKPLLTGPGQGLEFNLSHAGDRIVLAVARMPVGIDIEKIASEELALELEGEVFSPGELERIQSAEGDLRRELFYLGWVRKEALVKASGKGLSLPLKSFRVMGDSGSEGRPVLVDGFSLWDFRVEAGVLGAVAVEHSSPTFFCRSWVD